MSEPFMGEIKLVSFNFPPRGWAFCNGQLLPIQQNQALFALLGTTFGGNGMTTFALPNMCGRHAVHPGNGIDLGDIGGEAGHTLTANEIPAHTHALVTSNALATTANPTGAVLGKKGRLGRDLYAAPANVNNLSSASTAITGASQPHENQQPYVVLSAIIALQGIFPSST